jgi:hypothetical protein
MVEIKFVAEKTGIRRGQPIKIGAISRYNCYIAFLFSKLRQHKNINYMKYMIRNLKILSIRSSIIFKSMIFVNAHFTC